MREFKISQLEIHPLIYVARNTGCSNEQASWNDLKQHKESWRKNSLLFPVRKERLQNETPAVSSQLDMWQWVSIAKRD